GKIPLRAAGQKGLTVVPAGDGDRDWTGYLPWDGMPRLFNPPSGAIVTANNKVVAADYPYNIGGDYADPFRAARINERLQAMTGKATVADMEELQADVTSRAAAGLRPYLLALKPAGEKEKAALAEVAKWDLRFTRDSAGAVIYFAWFSKLLPEIVGDELSEERFNQYRPFGVTQTP